MLNVRLEPDERLYGIEIAEMDYVCGYCQNKVSSNYGMPITDRTDHLRSGGVYICPHCGLPTFTSKVFNKRKFQVPDVSFGDSVNHVPDDINSIYNEARDTYSAGAYTGVILICRTLLGRIAVDLGADEKLNFQKFVEFLVDNHLVTSRGEKWVDMIRKYGNETTHELTINTREDAEQILKFIEIILKTNYEFPGDADSLSNGKDA